MGLLDWAKGKMEDALLNVADKLEDFQHKLEMTPDEVEEEKKRNYRDACERILKNCLIDKISDTGHYADWEFVDKKETSDAKEFDMHGFDERFDETINFKDRYSAVRKGELWGIIDSSGKIIVKPVYEDIIMNNLSCNESSDVINFDFLESLFQFHTKNMFSDGLTNVKLNGKWGFIDKNGEIILEPKYEDIGEYTIFNKVKFVSGYGFYKGLAVVKENSLSYLIDKSEEKIAVSELSSPLEFHITDSDFDYYQFSSTINDNAYGLINKKTGEISEPNFGEICVVDKTVFAKEIDGELFGILDSDGQFIKEPEFLEISMFSDGLFIVKLDECRYKIINDKGKFITDTDFSEIYPHKNGYARIYMMDVDSYGYIDIEGNIVIKPQFDRASDFGDNGYAAVCIYDEGKYKCGYIDAACNMKIAPQFDDARSFSNGLAPVCKNKKWGYIDEAGTLVIDYQFDNAYEFHGKYANVTIITVTESEINKLLPYVTYEDRESFVNMYTVSLWIDKKGKLFKTIPDNKEYECLSFIPYESNRTIETDSFGIKDKEYLWGYYKIENGKKICIIKPQFTYAFDFDDCGCAEVQMPNGDYRYIKVQ